MTRILLALSFLTLPLFAKDINLQTDKFGSYFGGNIGQSAIGKDAFSGGAGAATEFEKSPTYNTGLEFGLIFNAFPQVTFRGGAEIIQPSKLTAASGTSSGGAEYMTMNSSVYAFNPKVSVDFNVIAQPTQRLYVSGTIGWTEISVENNYTMTAAGTTQYSKTDFDEKASGNIISWTANVGYEMHLFDNSTFILDVGYRSMNIKQLKLTAGTDSIAQGAVTKGTVLKNVDGTDRGFDLGGLYAGAAFRFYIHL